MINSVILFKYKGLTNRMLTALAKSDCCEARGDYAESRVYEREAILIDEERETLLSTLSNVEIGILMREDERRESKVKQG